MFLGTEFTWWIGVIEDNADPLDLCRAKVRIFGYHPDSASNKVLTEDLPWAKIIMPFNVPDSFHRPPLGEWVFGFFLDEARQEPAILGYFPALGSPRDANGNAISNSFSPYVSDRSFSLLNVAEKESDINGILAANTSFVIQKAGTVISISRTGNFSANTSNTINLKASSSGDIILESNTGIININRGNTAITITENGNVEIVANNITFNSSNTINFNSNTEMHFTSNSIISFYSSSEMNFASNTTMKLAANDDVEMFTKKDMKLSSNQTMEIISVANTLSMLGNKFEVNAGEVDIAATAGDVVISGNEIYLN